ncbi:MAG: VWA domain-containing protein [Treponema sp.]|nr:VWA domain-containing protein [Treponema sp.]
MSLALEQPVLFIAGIIFIPLGIFILRRLRDPLSLVLPLGPPGGVPFRPPFSIEWLVRVLRAAEYAGVFLLLLAASGPLVRTSGKVWLSRGADIIAVVDISPSMAALDMEGRSRFDAARDLIRSFAEKRPSDAIGLAAAGNDAALLVPATTDRRALFSRLESLRVGEMGDGTALGMGLAAAAFHLRNSTAPRRAVILVTDGENNAGTVHPETAAAMLPELGISLWVIGIGRGGEVPVDYVDPRTKMRRSGTFFSHFDPESLMAISGAGGGTFIRAPSAGAFADAFALVDEREMLVRRQGTVTETKSLRTPFIAAAFILIFLARLVRTGILGGRS